MKGELCIGLWLQMMMVKPVKKAVEFLQNNGYQVVGEAADGWKQLWYAAGNVRIL